MKLILKNVLMHMFQKKKKKKLKKKNEKKKKKKKLRMKCEWKKKYKKCGPVLRILTLKCKLCQAFSRYPKLNHG